MTVRPIAQRLTCGLRESQALTVLRDALLQKLISGELQVIIGGNGTSSTERPCHA